MRHQKNSLHHHSNPPSQGNLRLERWHRRCVYGACSWLVATGILWLIGHYLTRPVGEFGEGISPLEPWSMKLHGAGVLLALFFIGSLLNIHIRRAIKSGRNLYSGWAMIVVLAALTISGYALYYIAEEQNRPVWSISHWIIGLLFSGLIILHVVLGHKSSR